MLTGKPKRDYYFGWNNESKITPDHNNNDNTHADVERDTMKQLYT